LLHGWRNFYHARIGRKWNRDAVVSLHAVAI
jgi:hypothetical protein